MLPVDAAELVREADRAERGEVLAEAEPAIGAARGLDEMTRAAMRHVLTLRSHYEAALDELETATRAQPHETAAGRTRLAGRAPRHRRQRRPIDRAAGMGGRLVRSAGTARRTSRRGVHIVAEARGIHRCRTRARRGGDRGGRSRRARRAF